MNVADNLIDKDAERLDLLECKMDSMSDDGNMRYILAQHQQLPQPDRSENVVIFNLMEGTRENLMNKTKVLFKREGLKINDIEFVAAEHKESARGVKPGIVIATCATQDDRHRIMRAKRALFDRTVYRHVSMAPDRSPEQRAIDNNLCKLASVVDIQYRGGRLMHSHDSGQRAVHNHHTSRGSHSSPDRTRRHVENRDSPSCHRHGDRRQ